MISILVLGKTKIVADGKLSAIVIFEDLVNLPYFYKDDGNLLFFIMHVF